MLKSIKKLITVSITIATINLAYAQSANAAFFLIPFLFGASAKTATVAVGTKVAVAKSTAVAAGAAAKGTATAKAAVVTTTQVTKQAAIRTAVAPKSAAATTISKINVKLAVGAVGTGLSFATDIAAAYDIINELGLREDPNDSIQSDLEQALHNKADFEIKECVNPKNGKAYVASEGWTICPYTGEPLTLKATIQFQ